MKSNAMRSICIAFIELLILSRLTRYDNKIDNKYPFTQS